MATFSGIPALTGFASCFRIAAAAVALAAATTAFSQPLSLIPQPVTLAPESGSFQLMSSTPIACDSAADDVGHYLQVHLRELGWSLPMVRPATAARGTILLLLDLTKPSPAEGMPPSAEAYALHISPTGIELRARSTDGLFAGAATLLQIVTQSATASTHEAQLPAVRIEDAPRYTWRGLMLDESRHFYGKTVVRELLDLMAYLKLNRFHWHLTDESGWRIEIRHYPALTQTGAIGNESDPNAPAEFYTQRDIREIVAYAAERHITIVPEIDFPGHATAATRAYPELSGGGTGKWKGFTFDPASEETYRFMTDVLTEVAALFPGPYIHVGGDEVSFGNQDWSTAPEIVNFAHQHHLQNTAELEAYAVRRVANIVRRLGKTPLGWDEIVRDGVSPADSIAFWWHHDKPEVLHAALAAGYRVVLCPRLPCYFDFVQSSAHQVGRRWKGAYVDLRSVYRFPDVETNRPFADATNPLIQGMEACLWTEQIPDRDRLYFMLNPRLAALAEAAWTSADGKDYAQFLRRLPDFLRELKRWHIPYYDPFSPDNTPEPANTPSPRGLTGNG